MVNGFDSIHIVYSNGSISYVEKNRGIVNGFDSIHNSNC